MHRFYVPGLAVESGQFELPPAQARQIARVLRMRAGERIELFDGQGRAGVAELDEVGDRRVCVRLISSHKAVWPLPWRPVLYLALIRPQRFEWTIEKATELGAAAIVPVTTLRTTYGGEGLGIARRARWQQIAAEAAEQCGAAFVPELRPVVPFEQALTEDAGLRLFAWEGRDGAAESIAAVLAEPPFGMSGKAPVVALYVGPEGGFAPEEVQAAVAAGCRLITLGPRVLRAETAAVAALAVLLAAAASGSGAHGASLTP